MRAEPGSGPSDQPLQARWLWHVPPATWMTPNMRMVAGNLADCLDALGRHEQALEVRQSAAAFSRSSERTLQ